MARKTALFASPSEIFADPPLSLAVRSLIAARQKAESSVRPPSPFQQQIIACSLDLVLVGGRGGGKSYGVALRLADRINKYKRLYRALYIRQTYDSIEDFEEVCHTVFPLYCPGKYNTQKKTWRFDNGAFLKFSQLEKERDYRKLQGKSFAELIIDEACQFGEPKLLDLLLSNIRGPKGLPLSRIILANPGDVGHWWLFDRYIKDRQHGIPYLEPESDRQVVTLHSTYLDNPHQDNETYLGNLRSSTATDSELRKAFIDGDWNIARGAYFGTVLSKARSKVPKFKKLPDWRHFLTMDYGTAKPCAIYLMAISPGAMHEKIYYPAGSILAIDELYIADKPGGSQGLNLTVPQQSDRIKDFCDKWKVSPRNGHNVADDHCFAEDGRKSIGELFYDEGIVFREAGKARRVPGWEHMRTLLLHAGTEKPGLYISEACESFWKIMPSVPRDPKNPSDLDSSSNDHIADAIRYGCLATFDRSAPEGDRRTSWG